MPDQWMPDQWMPQKLRGTQRAYKEVAVQAQCPCIDHINAETIFGYGVVLDCLVIDSSPPSPISIIAAG